MITWHSFDTDTEQFVRRSRSEAFDGIGAPIAQRAEDELSFNGAQSVVDLTGVLWVVVDRDQLNDCQLSRWADERREEMKGDES